MPRHAHRLPAWPTATLLAAGALLAAAGLGIGTETLVAALGTGADDPARPAILAGARLFKACLVIDGALVWLVAACRRWRAPHWAACWTPPERDAAAADLSVRTYGIVLLLGLAVAIGLRLPGLDGDLWMDEVSALVEYVRQTPGYIVSHYTQGTNHMLFSLLAHASVAGFGDSPWALRLPALLFGVASLYTLARLGRYLFGRDVALAAAALLTVSYFHVWFSQNARGYTLLLCATLLASELLLRGLAGGRARIWAAYAATVTLGCWAMPLMVAVATAHSAIALGLALRAGAPVAALWRPALALAGAAWATVHLYAFMLPQMLNVYGDFDAANRAQNIPSFAAPKDPLWALLELADRLRDAVGLGWAGLALFAAAGAVGLLLCLRRRPAVVAVMLLPAAFTAAITYGLDGRLWPRLFFGSLGFAALLAVHGAFAIGGWLARFTPLPARRAGGAVALLLCLLFAVSLPRVYAYPKQDFTGALRLIQADLRPSDRVIIVGSAAHGFQDSGVDWPRVDSVAALQQRRAPHGRTWVVHTLPRMLATENPALSALLDREFPVLRVFPGTLGDGEVLVRRSAPD